MCFSETLNFFQAIRDDKNFFEHLRYAGWALENVLTVSLPTTIIFLRFSLFFYTGAWTCPRVSFATDKFALVFWNSSLWKLLHGRLPGAFDDRRTSLEFHVLTKMFNPRWSPGRKQKINGSTWTSESTL